MGLPQELPRIRQGEREGKPDVVPKEVRKGVQDTSTRKRDPDPETVFSENNKNIYVKHTVPGSSFFSDLWVWVSWIALRTASPRRPARLGRARAKAGPTRARSRRVRPTARLMALGEGQMGSPLMGSLQKSCF